VEAPAIEVERLRVVRGGRVVLDDLGFRVERGAVTGLLGPSGSGKSTLIRSIVGVQRVAAGAVRVLAHPAGSAELRSRVAYVTQAPSVYRDLTVAENVRYFGRILGVDREGGERAIETVGLTEFADRQVARLSDGQRARVSLATALLGTPDVLVLDEPTVGLDPLLRRELWATFNRLAEEGRTLLVSSHVLEEAEHCARLLLIRDGGLVADESPVDLLRRTNARNLDEAFLRLIEETE
jgi:ABC-2 type transport system ATP-binding protein